MLTVNGKTYIVLDPEQPDAHRVQGPAGQVFGVPCEDSAHPLTEEALETFLAAPPPAPVDPAAAWNAFLAGSIHDATTGIELKANRQARNDFIGQATLLREAVEAGLVTGTDPQSVWDAENVEHVLTVEGVRDLILRYGIAWQQAFNQLAP